MQWEGSSMKTNNSFENEAYYFNKYLKQAGILDQMSQDELDGLFSLSYNIGSTLFKNRTIPYLVKLYNGTGSVEDVLNHMYGDQDSRPHLVKGIAKRRKYEKDLFVKGYKNRISQRDKNVSSNQTNNFIKQQIIQQPDALRVEQYPQIEIDKVKNKKVSYQQPKQTKLDEYISYWTNNIPTFFYYPMNELITENNFIGSYQLPYDLRLPRLWGDPNVYLKMGGKLVKRINN